MKSESGSVKNPPNVYLGSRRCVTKTCPHSKQTHVKLHKTMHSELAGAALSY